jgi:hypothetical protein
MADMGWTIEYGPDGALGFAGQASATGRVGRVWEQFKSMQRPGEKINAGGGYPYFVWGDDPEVDLMVFASGYYLPSRPTIEPTYRGDYAEVRARVLPATPKGAVR